MSDKVRVNGNQYDQGSVTLKIRNEFFYGFTDITWSQKRERVKSVSTGKDRKPKGRTRGKYTTDPLKITFRRDSISELKLLLAAAAADGQSYGDPDDTAIVLQYQEDGSNQLPITLNFTDCAMTSDGGNSSEDGPDMGDVEFDYMFLTETIDGKTVSLFSAT